MQTLCRGCRCLQRKKTKKMEFDMNQIPQTSNSNGKIEASESQNSEVQSENSAVQSVEPENVDSNTLAAVLQFLQKHNLKVTGRDTII